MDALDTALRRVARRLDGVSLALPMALVLAGALAFAFWAMLPLAGTVRDVAALAGGAAGGVGVWALFAWLERPAGTRVRSWRDLLGGVAEHATMPALRRADAHPDAPARRPIFAAEDLGASFDTITTDWRPDARWTDAPEAPEPAPDPASEPPVAPDALLLRPGWQAPADEGSAAVLMARLEAALALRSGGAARPVPVAEAIDEVMAELRKAVTRG